MNGAAGVVVLLVALVASSCKEVHATMVNISNTIPRRDTSGKLMDVHDGNILLINGTYHWYGMGYRNCTETTGIIPPVNCVSESGR